MIKAIIFDVDGTLYNETDVKMIAELETAVHLASCSDVTAQTIYTTFRKVKSRVTDCRKGWPEANDRAIWYGEVLQELGISCITGAELGDFYWRVVYENMKPFEDFIYILPRLREKYRLYVLTDELQAIQQRKLRRLGLEEAFIKAVSAEQIGATKPSEKCFRYMADIIGEPCKNILVAGDNPAADIRGGKRSGMHTAWLRRGKYHYYPRKPEEEPEIVFTNYIQLMDKIDSLEEAYTGK